MDRQYADAAIDTAINAPVIQRAGDTSEETFVPAAQSQLLNGVLGAFWAYNLLTVLSAVGTDGPREEIPSLLYGFAVGLNQVLLFGTVAVIGFAMQNSKVTAPLSFGLALGSLVFASLCGILGHPSSAWIGDLAFGAVVAVASVAIFARRAQPEPSVA